MRQAFASLIPLVLAASACQPARPEGVAALKVRLPVLPDRPGVAYFDLTGGKTERRLIGVSSPQVIRIELHESKAEGSKMNMRPLEGGIPIPAGETVRFQSGGKHAMLFDINPRVRAGEKMPMTFSFTDGHKIEAEALVERIGSETEHQH